MDKTVCLNHLSKAGRLDIDHKRRYHLLVFYEAIKHKKTTRA